MKPVLDILDVYQVVAIVTLRLVMRLLHLVFLAHGKARIALLPLRLLREFSVII